MKRWIVAAAALLAFSMLPSPGMELGELHPVSLLLVEVSDKTIQLETDTHQSGQGETLGAALENLEKTTPGTVFLDTAEHLILGENAGYLIPELRELLRPGVTVCMAQGEVDTEKAAEYLDAHTPEATLSESGNGSQLPILYETEGRYLLEN